MKTSLRLSASLYKKFLNCPKQAYFIVDDNSQKNIKTSPAAALGKIAHKIVEFSVHNPENWTQEQLTVWFNSKWTEIVGEEYDAMKKQWFPNQVINPPTWRGYFKQQAAAKTLVVQRSGLLPSKRVVGNKFDGQKTLKNIPSFPLVERFLDDSIMRIHGQPDFVFIDDGILVLIDYKFGQDNIILTEHKIQMHFYILLIESIFNRTVEKCAIVASTNKVFTMLIDREFLVELKTDIIRVLGALESGKVAAVPKLENCVFCNFKTNCREFADAKIVNIAGNPLLVQGIVKEIKNINDMQVEVLLKTDISDSTQELRIFGIPKGHQVEVGSKLKVFDNLHFHSDTRIEFSWNSQLEFIKN